MRVSYVLGLGLVCLAACDFGEGGPPGGPPGGQTVDAPGGNPTIDAPSVGLDSGGTDAGGGSAAFVCRPTTAPEGDGHHNPGLDCMNACHNHGFTVAGTLYTNAAGTTPIGGATVTLFDAAGHTIDVVSSSNGNFYTVAPVVYPVTVKASACPTISSMVGTVAASGAGCNKTGCHDQPTGQGRVHLP